MPRNKLNIPSHNQFNADMAIKFPLLGWIPEGVEHPDTCACKTNVIESRPPHLVELEESGLPDSKKFGDGQKLT